MRLIHVVPLVVLACMGAAFAAPAAPFAGYFTSKADSRQSFLVHVDPRQHVEVIWGPLGRKYHDETCQGQLASGELRFKGMDFQGTLRPQGAGLRLTLMAGKESLGATLGRATRTPEATRGLLRAAKAYGLPSGDFTVWFDQRAHVRSGNEEQAMPLTVLWDGYLGLDGRLTRLTDAGLSTGNMVLVARATAPPPLPAPTPVPRVLQMTLTANGPVRVRLNGHPYSYLDLDSEVGGVSSAPLDRRLLKSGTNAIDLEPIDLEPDFTASARLEDLPVGHIVDSSAKSSSGKKPILSSELTAADLRGKKAVHLEFRVP